MVPMNAISIVLLLLWILDTSNSPTAASQSSPFANHDSKRCGNTVIKAESRTKTAETPGFPKSFPGDITCTWAIYSKPGKRIRLEFKKFHLLGPVDGHCYYQSVMVRSPFTLFSMGPYCGETSLPTIISTGNLIYIELTTPVPVTTDNYAGFQIAFKETTESSSYELRPDNSADDVIMTIDPATMNIISPTVPTTTVTTERTTRSTTKPSRWRPGLTLNRNVRPTPTKRSYPPRNTRTRYPPRQNPNIRPPSSRPNDYPGGYNGGYRNSPSKTKVVRPEKEDENEWKIEIIVAIAVGGLVVIAIIIAIAVKAHLCQKKKQERKEDAASSNEIKMDPHAEKAGTLPAYNMNPNADQIFYQAQYHEQPYYYYYDGAENYPMQQIDPNVNPPRGKPKSSTLPVNYGVGKDSSSDSRRKKRVRKSRSSTNIASVGRPTSRRVDNTNKKRNQSTSRTRKR